MTPDMPLDYALFQLDSTRSRCEIWISAGGETEKLASGLLKPFLAHLRAAQEQISSGAQSIRLQAPSVTANGRNSGAAWFSKGTMERFVRFVSIPEVLEHVSAVEAECQRLQDAINILATESGGDHLFDASVLVPPGAKPLDDKSTSKTGGLNKLKQDYHDAAETIGDTSKKQLLRAMDGRRAMLQKEQRKALAQAVAAGFNMECMPDLVVFADCFGAIQLRDACVKFMALQKKIQEYGSLIDEMELAAETVSTGLKMNKSGIILLAADNSVEVMSMGLLDDSHEKLVIASSDNKNHDKLSINGLGRANETKLASKMDSPEPQDSFKRKTAIQHSHLNARKDARRYSIGNFQHDQDNMENSESCWIGKKNDHSNYEDRNSDSKKRFPLIAEVATNLSVLEMDKADTPFDTSIVQGKDLQSDNEVTESSTRCLARRPASPKRRSSSPFRKVQIGYSPVRRQGVIVTRSFGNLSLNSKKAGYAKKQISVDSEDSDSDEESESKDDSNEERQGSRNESRRLSVQDAISLFESKRKESTEIPLHKASQNNNHKEPGECETQEAYGKDALRWSGPCPKYDNAVGSPEKMEDISSTNTKISKYHDKCNAGVEFQSGNTFQSMTSERCEKLPPLSARVGDDEYSAEHENKKEQLLPPNESRITHHIETPTSRQQLPENSRLQTVYASSVSLEHEKQNEHRGSLPTSVSHSASHRDQVTSITSGLKDSVLDRGQVFKPMVVKRMVSSEKATCFEQRKPKQQELRRNSNIPVHHKTREDAGLGKVSYTGRLPKASPDNHPDMEFAGVIPRESSRKVTNVAHRRNQHQVKERLEGGGSLRKKDNLKEKIAGIGNVRKSWSTPSNFHLEALAKMVDNKDNEDEEQESKGAEAVVKDLKGHFYEQYRQKRDAKLRQDSGFKRAERDAKMKAMQEALERRKEELTGKKTKLNEDKHADSARTEKIHALKEGLTKMSKEKAKSSKEMGGKKNHFDESRSQQQQKVGVYTLKLQESQSASSTPRIRKVVNTKPDTFRKLSPSSQNSSSSVIATYSGTRTVGNSSPKSLSKFTNRSGARPSQRRVSSGSQANMAENLFSRSVPASLELRKESLKQTSSHIMQSSHQEKRNSSKNLDSLEHLCVPNDEVVAFDTKELTLPESLVQGSESMTEFRKSTSSPDHIHERKLEPSESYVNNGQSDAIFKESDVTFEVAKTSHEESGEFSTETHSILKSSIEPDAVKINCEEGLSSSSSNIIPVESGEPDNCSPMELEETSPLHIDTTHGMQYNLANAKQLPLADETVHQFHGASEEASSYYQCIQGISIFDKTGLEAPQEAAMDPNDHVAHSSIINSSFVESGNSQSSNLHGLHSTEMFQSSKMDAYDVSLTRSFSSPSEASKLHDILNAPEADPLSGSVTMPSIHDPQLILTVSKGHHDPSPSTTSPSMIPRPISRSYPQEHPSASSTVTSVKPDTAQSRKMWNSSQKSVLMSSQHTQKEPSKGFKRLLKFGRKSRGSEPSTQDWIAASTSEGDEDGDESKNCVADDELRASVSGSNNALKNTERASRTIDFNGENGTAPRSFFFFHRSGAKLANRDRGLSYSRS